MDGGDKLLALEHDAVRFGQADDLGSERLGDGFFAFCLEPALDSVSAEGLLHLGKEALRILGQAAFAAASHGGADDLAGREQDPAVIGAPGDVAHAHGADGLQAIERAIQAGVAELEGTQVHAGEFDVVRRLF